VPANPSRLFAISLLVLGNAACGTTPSDGGTDAGRRPDAGRADDAASVPPDAPSVPVDAPASPDDGGAQPCDDVCSTPPSVCYEPTGTCTAGSCTYSYRDGVACDDGSSATEDDRCGSGICAGTPSTDPWVEIRPGATATCVRRTMGSVMCWGYNLGRWIDEGMGEIGVPPTAIGGVTDAVEIATGATHGCARRASGRVACWGLNASGELGAGSSVDRSTTALEVASLSDAVEVKAAWTHTCARRASGSVVCWGTNGSGELGDGSETSRRAPVDVVGLTDAVELTAGGFHTCARRAGGSVECWGWNDYGQLGDGTMDDRLSPTAVPGIDDAVELTAGYAHTCARRASGGLVCWGNNEHGELGDGTMIRRTVPVAVSGIADAVALAAGEHHTCAVHGPARTVSCWGWNVYGALGDGTTTDHSTPAPVTDLDEVAQLSAGGSHTCVARTSGALLCWGLNSYGQVGDRTSVNRLAPTPVMLPAAP
jgi:hypothetical protein